jgi:7,8-dihydroneopterin aldolase/epimerase/oxygenase
LSRARNSDDLRDTLDYAVLHALVLEVVRERSYALLERLGDELVRAIMRDQRVRRATVRIAKPGLLEGATPAVTVCAERP